MTIVISTAYLDEAERCNRLALAARRPPLYCDTPAALKERMPGALLPISSPDGRARARRAIARLDGVSHVMLVGDGVHAVVDDAERRIAASCARRSIAPASLQRYRRRLEPSIEDVFVALA